MDLEKQIGVNFRVTKLNNSSWLISSTDHRNNTFLDQPPFKKPTYDDEGALYYVIAVLFMYALSIILMIGSLIKKSKHDNGMSKYMEDLDKVRKVERRQQKSKIRLAMQNNKKVARAIERRMSTPCVLEMQEALNNTTDVDSVNDNSSNNGESDYGYGGGGYMSSQESGLCSTNTPTTVRAMNLNKNPLFLTRCHQKQPKGSNSSQSSLQSATIPEDDVIAAVVAGDGDDGNNQATAGEQHHRNNNSNNRPRAASDDAALKRLKMKSLTGIEEEDEVFIV